MSRVIKSTSVKIQSIRVLGSNSVPVSAKTENDDSVVQVKEQAGQILLETEQMVKELIQTARQEAEKIIGNANEEAFKIIADSEEKLKQAEEEGFRQGWQSGYEEGGKTAEDEYSHKLLEAQQVVEEAHQERMQIIAGAEDEVVQLAMAVSRKIIERELVTRPEIIVEMVKRAIQKVTDREELTVRVNPDNLDSTINAQEEIAQSAKGVRKLKVLADPAIASGGCVVESSNGTVDARVERQLNEIEQALMEVSPNAKT